jgi:hypothetical protein
MASGNPEFYGAGGFTPEAYEPPRGRGCMFYGCLIAGIMSVLFLIAVGAILYVGYRAFNRFVDEYTATVPLELPTVEMPAEERQSVKDRFAAFRKAIDDGTPVEPLVLTSDDLNALIEDQPNLKGRIFVRIEGDKLRGQVSIPLDSMKLPIVSGRYLNGEADLKASLSDGVLIVTLEDIEVNGKRLPPQLMDSIRKENLAKDAYKDAKSAEQVRKLESIEIKDGKITIRARARKPGSGAEAPDARGNLPTDVIAPPGTGKSEPDRPKTEAPPAREPAKEP